MRGALIAVVASAVTCLLLATGSAATNPIPDTSLSGPAGYLGRCSSLPDSKRTRCYVRGLLRAVERLGNPAHGLPRIDRKVRAGGGFLVPACHALMHEVGRTWARRHGVTLASLYRYVPRSNDPGCSAGFGMGMVMYIGPELVYEPRKALESCSRLTKRFREYTCVHGSGHALMRGYHGQLRDAVTACRKLGRTSAPDCAQGAFHDYWISLSGADDTERPKNADPSPRSVCGRYASYPRPCWYRYFWERQPDANVYYPDDIRRLCRGLVALQRAGCVGGASLVMSKARDPIRHAQTCGGLEGADAVNCLRGVPVPELTRHREQLDLIRTCRGFSQQTRAACYSWFGRTLAVVTNGRFRRSGCPRLRMPAARASCIAGTARANEPLRTFS